ncbi:hypothetical protein DL96DRAFT_1008095 [Flagelloscypha sp. PMI_526]|nr:hypothetical protein DL96DRAFT_1008095 [Flagelloscypha sp. PMI_526]
MMTTINQISSLAAALTAGKLPSTSQTNRTISNLLQSNLIQLEKTVGSEGKLSQHGSEMAKGVREILEAWKVFGENKNGDDILQEALYNLSQGSANGDIRLQKEGENEAGSDARELSTALSTLVHAALGNGFGVGSSLFTHLASFIRLQLADTAESVEAGAASTKQLLRGVDKEVEEGERNALGLPSKQNREGSQEELDTRGEFERKMDAIKEVGSKGIGLGQTVKEQGKDYAERSRTRVEGSLDKIIRRSLSDPDYQNAVSIIFGLARKWLSTQSSSTIRLDTFVDDPNGYFTNSLQQLRTFIERCAAGRSLDHLQTTFEQVANTIHDDDDLRAFVDDYLVYAQRNVESVDYYDSQEGQRTKEELENRVREIRRGEKWGQYKESMEKLQRELEEYQRAFASDSDFKRLHEAHLTLSTTIVDAGKEIVGSTNVWNLSGASWIWQDIFSVYLPRLMVHVKAVPLPRTEYADDEIEVVFENADISSMKLLPGHVHIRQVIDVDTSLNQPSFGANTATSGSTQLQFQGVQLSLSAVSFYYHEKKSGTPVPSTFTGLLEMELPSKGLDIDVQLSSNESKNAGEAKRFFKVDKVNVHISKETNLSVKKSNHPILTSAFKPAFKSRFLSALSTALEQNVRSLIDFVDFVAYDTKDRAQVFEDGGMPPAPAYAGAIWSELGRLIKLPGPFTGWGVIGHGIVKDDDRTDKVFAVGKEPMVLDGSKKGPLSQFSKPVETGHDESLETDNKEKMKSIGQENAQKVMSFKDSVNSKREQERAKDGWRSEAFDAFV